MKAIIHSILVRFCESLLWPSKWVLLQLIFREINSPTHYLVSSWICDFVSSYIFV